LINEIINIPNKKLSTKEYREWIENLEQEVIDSVEEAMDRHTSLSNGYKLEEAFTPGIYVRELTMPAGQLVFSLIHKQEHPYLVTKGKVSVYDGEQIYDIEAPFKGVTKAGTKRVLYTHEETTWITFHPTNEKREDMAEVITCERFSDYEKLEVSK